VLRRIAGEPVPAQRFGLTCIGEAESGRDCSADGEEGAAGATSKRDHFTRRRRLVRGKHRGLERRPVGIVGVDARSRDRLHNVVHVAGNAVGVRPQRNLGLFGLQKVIDHTRAGME
jgi:hypothetical protein